jgi:hypothetical protein
MNTTITSAASHDGRARPRRGVDRLAARLALAGASLGVLVGLLELTIGPSIRDWVGNKQDTTRLGLTTTVLSAVALAAGVAVWRAHDGVVARRVAVGLGLLMPALICFTTVGQLWYLPGPLLLTAGALVLAGTRRQEFAAALDERHWRVGLLLACGAYYVFLGATALGVIGVLGILGGVCIWAAARAAPQTPRAAYCFLLAGALPFALATWWSAVTPLIAVLAVILGHGVIRHAGRAAHATPPVARRSVRT